MLSIESKMRRWFDSASQDNDLEEFGAIVRSLSDQLTPTWHPLGFIHVRLLSPSAGESFRLHLWPADYQHNQEQVDKIHDHLFNVTSKVLCGAVTNFRYTFSPDENGEWRELRVRYGPQVSSLCETGVVGNLQETEAQTFSAQSTYHVPRFALHQTASSSAQDTLTVVYTDSAVQYEPRAMFHRTHPAPSPRAPIPCDKSYWLNRLSKLIPL